MSAPVSFYEAVLSWLRTEGGVPTAAQVVAVSGDGTDWAGDTESGFYERFGADVAWLDEKGNRHIEEVLGSRMESLWMWVMRAWPEQTGKQS